MEIFNPDSNWSFYYYTLVVDSLVYPFTLYFLIFMDLICEKFFLQKVFFKLSPLSTLLWVPCSMAESFLIFKGHILDKENGIQWKLIKFLHFVFLFCCWLSNWYFLAHSKNPMGKKECTEQLIRAFKEDDSTVWLTVELLKVKSIIINSGNMLCSGKVLFPTF